MENWIYWSFWQNLRFRNICQVFHSGPEPGQSAASSLIQHELQTWLMPRVRTRSNQFIVLGVAGNKSCWFGHKGKCERQILASRGEINAADVFLHCQYWTAWNKEFWWTLRSSWILRVRNIENKTFDNFIYYILISLTWE